VAAALFFICTLGTGMLGFGIGSGWAYFTESSESGFKKSSTGDNSFPKTTYIFEPVDEERPVATLSDMLELVSPSVVGITTYREEPANPFGTAHTATKSHGSGIIFEASHDRIFIATNFYVVRGGHRWDISIAGSEPIRAHPVSDNRGNDLAVLCVFKNKLT